MSAFKSLLAGWILLVLVSWPEQAGAAEDTRLYSVGVDVTSRSLEDRRAGAAKGLLVMLTRLSGLTDLPRSSALTAAGRRPERYYSQYRYLSTDRYDELGAPLTQLRLQFSPPALRELMAAAQLPLWTLNRPRLAVWLAERTAEGSDVIEDPKHPLLAAVLAHAEYRGLPTLLPGLASLSERDLWNRNSGALRSVADRLGAQLMLVGRAEQLGPQEWQVSWTSWGSGGGATGSSTASYSGALDVVAPPAVDRLVNTLVNQFTVAGGEAGTLELVVENVAAVEDYAALLKYLSSRSYIEQVSVTGIRDDELSLVVSTTGSAEKLMQLLSIDSRLVASTRPQRLTPLAPVEEPLEDNQRIADPDSVTEYGARTAVTVGAIADARLRVAWQG